MPGLSPEAIDAATPKQAPMNPEIQLPAQPTAQEIGQLPVEASVEPMDGPLEGQAAVIRPAVSVGNAPIGAEGPKDIPVKVTFH